MKHCSARRIAGIALIVVGSVSPVLLAADAASAATYQFTVTPGSDLKDGSSVQIAGTGWPASTTVFITECANSSGSAGCDTAHLLPTTTSAAGVLSATFTIHTGTIGNGTCGPGATTCLIGIGDAGGTVSGDTPISFAAAAAASPSVAATPAASPTAAATPAASSSPSVAAVATTAAAAPSPDASTAAPVAVAASTVAPTAIAAGTGGSADRRGGLGAVEISLIVVGGVGVAASGIRLARSRSSK